MRTLMEMGHFPSGMEFFSAIDGEQWPFLEKVIDDSDYYVLILGGRYGSLADEEISYTEKEFDYANDTGKKIIALVHGSPDSLAAEKTDMDNALRIKLQNFRKKVCTGRMVKFWNKPEELAGHIALALPKTIQLFPATGWVRANKVASIEILEQLNEFRTENDKLKSQLASQRTKAVLPISKLDEEVEISLTIAIGKGDVDYQNEYHSKRDVKKDLKVKLSHLFNLIGEELQQKITRRVISSKIGMGLGLENCKFEPPRVCWRLLTYSNRSHYEQYEEQIFT